MYGISTIREQLTSSSIDAFLISSYANISYITNFFGFSQIERDAYILVTQHSCYLFTNPLYEHSFSNANHPFKLVITTPSYPFIKHFHTILKNESITSIAFEEDSLTISEFSKMQKDGIDFIPDTLSHLRRIKTKSEITKMQNVCKLTDEIFEEFIKTSIKPGISEIELAKRLEMITLKKGAGFSFPAIVAFGKNAAVPHHHTDTTKLAKNDGILIDFGIILDNYCSDMTRTFFVGKSDTRSQNAYNIVLTSQEKAITYIQDNLKQKNKIKLSDVDKVAREYIVSQKFPSIPHSLGHGIGIQVHEAPSLSPGSEETLQDGMVFSIEPGVYLPNKFGIRIEDLFAVQDNMLIQLTNSPQKLIIL